MPLETFKASDSLTLGVELELQLEIGRAHV